MVALIGRRAAHFPQHSRDSDVDFVCWRTTIQWKARKQGRAAPP